MAKRSVLLIAAPGQEGVVRAISRRLTVTGVIGAGRSRFRPPAGVPVVADLPAALAMGRTDVVCFLAPASRMVDVVEQAANSGLPVLCAGPPDLSMQAWRALSDQMQKPGPALAWGRRFAYSDVHRRLLEQRDQPAVGDPVYLRCIGAGNGGVLSTWWALCEMVAQAVDLLGADPVRLYVTAKSARRKCHAVATAVMANRSSAQLVAVPSRFPCCGDLTLLCSGGLVSSRAGFGGAVGSESDRAPDYWLATPDLAPEPEWLADFADRCDTPEGGPGQPLSTYPAQRAILTALRSSLRRGEVVEARPA